MVNRENDPLLKGTTERAYNIKAVDEEYIASSDSSTTTIDEHDADYLIKHRLGQVSLTMVTVW